MDRLSWSPIGDMRTCFKTKNGTPRQGTISASSKGVLTISKSTFTNPEHSLEGLKEYSYVWLLFAFHLNANKGVKAKVKPPRLDGAKLGVFATRSPHRPNPIGLTLAKIESVEGASVTVSGIDIVDGTPIIDIKPFIPTYDNPQSSAHDEQTPNDTSGSTVSSSGINTVRARDIDSSLWDDQLLPELNVIFTQRAEADIEDVQKGMSARSAQLITDSQSMRKAIVDVLKADPRSVYRRKKCTDR